MPDWSLPHEHITNHSYGWSCSKSQQEILEDQHQVPYKVNIRIKEIKNILLLSYYNF